MKISTLFAAAIILISAASLADDHIQVSKVKASHWDIMKVELPAGIFEVQVETNDDKKIDCVFYQFPKNGWQDFSLDYNEDIVFYARDTNICIGQSNSVAPEAIYVAVFNHSGNDQVYSVWVRDPIIRREDKGNFR